jgi:hypothetical protein
VGKTDEVLAAGVAAAEEVGAGTAAVDPHHHVVAAEVVVLGVAVFVGPVEFEAGCRENVVEFAAAAATNPFLVHVVLLVGLSPTASPEGRYLVFRGFRGFVVLHMRRDCFYILYSFTFIFRIPWAL